MCLLAETDAFRDDSFDFGGPADSGYDGCFDDELRHKPCTCGYRDALENRNDYDDPIRHEDFCGCVGCDPADYDAKPTGIGMELWERPTWIAANETANNVYVGGPYRRLTMSVEDRQARRRAGTSRYDSRLVRAADRLWRRLVDEYETSREARAKFTAWANRTLARSKP